MFISNGCCSKLLQTTGLKTTETVSQLEVRSPKSRHQQSHISSEVSRRGSFPVSAQASAGGPWCVWACRHISLIFQCLSSRGILHCVFTTSSFCTCFHIFLFFFFLRCLFLFVFVCTWASLLCCVGFSLGAASVASEHRLSSCGSQGWLLHGLWVLGSPIREGIHVPYIGRRILNHRITREALPMTSYKDTSCWMKAQPNPV